MQKSKEWLVANWRYVLGGIILIVLLGIVLQKCTEEKPKDYTPIKVPSSKERVDSLIREIQKEKWIRTAAERKADSLEDLLARQGIELAVANKEQQMIAAQYKKERERKDTTAAFRECDALAATVNVQATRLQRFEETTTALVGILKEKELSWERENAKKDTALLLAVAERDTLRSALEREQLWNKATTADYNKMLKRSKRQKTGNRLLAAAVIVLGIITITK